MSLPLPACLYITTSLENTPATVAALLAHLPAGDPAWETQPDSDRFRLREIVAHLADWEDVWQDRFERTLNEETPLIVRPDIHERAVERGYADADPQESLTRFVEKRQALTIRLRSLPDDAWERMARFDRMGHTSLGGLAALALGHDSYHVRQVAEWLSANH